ARARGGVDVERDTAPAGLGLGAADRRPARTARARRTHAVLAAQAMGGGRRAATASDGAGRSGGCAREARSADRPRRSARGATRDGRGGLPSVRAQASQRLAQPVGRWAAYAKDGDRVGGDLPGWLPSLFRRAGAAALTDRRGECVYAGCPHYRRCFIERAERASREADIVIANHALVMVNAAHGREDGPGRILFVEGHHL